MDILDPVRARACLQSAVMETLAEMAFLDALPPEDRKDESAEPLDVRAAIDVLKPTSCRVEIRSPSEFRGRISDILFPPGEGEGAQDDAFLEILNVATGKFLTDYFEPGTEMKLELPRFLFLDDGAEGREICSFELNAEGFPVSVILSSVRYRY